MDKDKQNKRKSGAERSKKFRENHPRRSKIQMLAGAARYFIKNSDESELKRLDEIEELYVKRIKEIKNGEDNK